jgi:hypothetical protein
MLKLQQAAIRITEDFIFLSRSHDSLNFHIRCAPVSTGNTLQDLPQLRETADNTERYI